MIKLKGRALRILLFDIENALDLKIRTGADPHSFRTLRKFS